MRVFYGIVKILAVFILHGTSIFDELEKRIFLVNRNIVRYNSQTVSIPMVHERSVDNQTAITTTKVISGSILAAESENQ